MRILRVFACCLGLSSAFVMPAISDNEIDVKVTSRPIRHFKIGSQETKFGPLEFVGGLEMAGDSRHFGAISSFRFRVPGADFVAVTDTGYWVFGEIVRDGYGRPFRVANVHMEEILNAEGKRLQTKGFGDAESLQLRGNRATVGFERAHRIEEFNLNENSASPPLKRLNYLVPRYELRDNRGFETIAAGPQGGRLHGARIAISEKSLDKNGNIFAAILEGKGKGVFTVKRRGAFDITDGAFMPNGDLIILERSYSIATSIGMRLRRIAGDTIKKGALVDGEILFSANLADQIDNMEGLDIWRASDGSIHLAMMSDDNHSILQRNLYLEFKFVE